MTGGRPRAQAVVHEIVADAVRLEREFCCEALSCALVGMNAGLMGQYIEFVADRLLIALGCERLYNVANPFDWMEMISLQARAAARRACHWQLPLSLGLWVVMYVGQTLW